MVKAMTFAVLAALGLSACNDDSPNMTDASTAYLEMVGKWVDKDQGTQCPVTLSLYSNARFESHSLDEEVSGYVEAYWYTGDHERVSLRLHVEKDNMGANCQGLSEDDEGATWSWSVKQIDRDNLGFYRNVNDTEAQFVMKREI